MLYGHFTLKAWWPVLNQGTARLQFRTVGHKVWDYPSGIVWAGRSVRTAATGPRFTSALYAQCPVAIAVEPRSS